MTSLVQPPLIPMHDLMNYMQKYGYFVVYKEQFSILTNCSLSELDELRSSWQSLPQDVYLKDGGRYRQRRHSCFVAQDNRLTLMPHRAHWQPLIYNALHGGMKRWFEPIEETALQAPAWHKIMLYLSHQCSQLKDVNKWYIEAHQFRINTQDGIGRPTPEGAHRDGVDFVAVIMVERANIKGGESRVFEADGPNGQRFTLTSPWTLLLLDDERVIHESTPIQPVSSAQGYRDTLVLTFRQNGFQEA